MKRLIVTPSGWPCELGDCPPGLFVFQETLGIKTEYSPDGKLEVYIADSGEFFWGGAKTVEEQCALVVQPCEYEWRE